MLIKSFVAVSVFVALSSVVNAQSPNSWAGDYVYEHSYGENAGGAPMIVEYRLRIGNGCRISADGYQTNERIICRAVLRPNGLVDVNYVSFRNGDEGQYTIGSFYKSGDRLFSMSQHQGKIFTGWGVYSPFENKRPVGRFFQKVR